MSDAATKNWISHTALASFIIRSEIWFRLLWSKFKKSWGYCMCWKDLCEGANARGATGVANCSVHRRMKLDSVWRGDIQGCNCTELMDLQLFQAVQMLFRIEKNCSFHILKNRNQKFIQSICDQKGIFTSKFRADNETFDGNADFHIYFQLIKRKRKKSFSKKLCHVAVIFRDKEYSCVIQSLI